MAEKSSNAGAKPEGGAKNRPIKTLPTDRIQFEKQLDLLRAYAAVSGPSRKAVTNKDVAAVVGMVASTVSISNKFFSEMGFLSQAADGGYVPTADVVSYARAYEWKPDTASHKLAPTVLGTWFAQKVVPKLRFRPMPEEEAIADLADEAHAGPSYASQLRVLLDYLEAAGIVTTDDAGQLRLGPAANATVSEPTATTAGAAEPPKEPAAKAAAVATGFAAPTEGVVQFHVSVKVDMAEFEGWEAERIASFFSGIAQVLAAKSKIEEGASGS